MDLMRMLAEANGRDEARRPKPQADAVAARLREALVALNETHEFQPGDLVTMKPDWENRRDHWAGQPMVVVDVSAADYCFVPHEHGSPVQQQNIVTGSLDPDGNVSLRLYDRRFLMPWSDPFATPSAAQ